MKKVLHYTDLQSWKEQFPNPTEGEKAERARVRRNALRRWNRKRKTMTLWNPELQAYT